MQKTLKAVEFGSLFLGENVRLSSNLAIPELMEDIGSNGLLKPLYVWAPDPSKERFEVLVGNRRTMALKALKESDKDTFEARFPDGRVEVFVCTDMTREEATTFKVDHGNERALTHPVELQLCANMLFACGHTEGQVTIELAGLMDSIRPMNQTKRQQYDNLVMGATAAREQKKYAQAKAMDAEAEALLKEYRRGLVQGLHNRFRCPDIVMAAILIEAGEDVKGYEDVPMPKHLTDANVRELFKAHEKDMSDTNKKGLPKWSKRKPGPLFQAKWKEIIEAESKKAEDKKEGKARPKAMPASKMAEELKDGKFSSELAQYLVKHHMGEDVDAKALAEADLTAYYAELVKLYDPDTWQLVVDTAHGIEDQLKKDAEVEEEVVEEEVTDDVAE